MVEVRFGDDGGDQSQEGNVILVVNLRGEVKGMGSNIGEKVGAVASMAVLLSCHPTWSSGAPLSSYRTDDKIGIAVWVYGQSFRAFRDIAVLSDVGAYARKFSPHSLLIGGCLV